jgi:hypothetical protein
MLKFFASADCEADVSALPIPAAASTPPKTPIFSA